MSQGDEEEDDLANLDFIAGLIERGEDDYELPDELLIEAEEEEKRLGLAQQIAALPVGHRLKLALKGNKEARMILIRDPARIVRRFVLQNPRVTEDEVVMICKNRSAESEMLERISKKREWVQNYQVRLALTTNPKTPMGIGLRLVRTLVERDVRAIAKSKNVPAAVNSTAKRMIIEKGPSSSGGGGH